MNKHLYILFFLITFIHAKTFQNIEFKGDVDLLTGEFDRSTLLKICHIEYPAIYKIWRENPVFDSSEIKGFVENLVDYSKSMGYYRVKVTSSTDSDTIYLTIKKNQAIKIASLQIDEEFRHFLLFKKGKRFKTTDFTASKKKIVRFLKEHGYPTFSMDAKAFVDLDLYKVDVNISIDKGIKRYFGTTDINNSSDVDNFLVSKELVYKKGTLYNILKIEKSYDNLYRLGVFETIKMKADFNTSDGKTPIYVTLKEGKTKEFASNLGYDTEDGARGGAEYIDHNFFGNLREFRAKLQISERGYQTKTSYYDPRLENPVLGDFSFRNEVEFAKWDYDSYIQNVLSERVTFGKSFIGLNHFFGFQMEYLDIESDIPEFLEGNYLINSLFYRVIVDNRDSKMDAKNGDYYSLYLEKSMKDLGSDIDYFKILGEVRYLKEFKPFVLASKLKVGAISQETPTFKHFFLGGAMSNRGYEYRDLGEHVGKYPVGGLSSIDSSLEARYYLTENFSVVSFFDSSKLSNEVNDFSGQWYNSYGLGLRYLSVIGPLRLDIGYPQGGGFALHLGIGQVF
jgi:translocation and assembly module TamA